MSHIVVTITMKLQCVTAEKKGTNRVMYGENTVMQNAKQILCLFSACDHLKGIFLEAQANISPCKMKFPFCPSDILTKQRNGLGEASAA